MPPRGRLLAVRRLCTATPSKQLLSFEEVAAPPSSNAAPRVAFVLHGLLGQARNWRSFTKSLADAADGAGVPWRFLLVDLRHHGRSSGRELSGGDDLHSAAADVERLACAHSPDLVLGHSLGGKVALSWAAQTQNAPVSVVALDSSPGTVGSDPHGTEAVLDLVGSLPSQFASREECKALLNGRVSPAISAWLLSSLVAADEPSRLRFAFDLPGARRLFDSYKESCTWSALEKPKPGQDVLLVRAGKSQSWTGEAGRRFEALRAAHPQRAMVLEDAGHWLHTERPAELQSMLLPLLLRPRPDAK